MENEELEEIDDLKNSDNSSNIYFEDVSEITNELMTDNSSNTIIENEILILEKLDNHTTCLNAIFFLICLWFVIDVMRRMINTK